MVRPRLSIVVFSVLVGVGLPELLHRVPPEPAIVFTGTFVSLALFFAVIWRVGQRRKAAVPRPAMWSPQQRRLELQRAERALSTLQKLRQRPLHVMLFLFFGTGATGTAFFFASTAQISNAQAAGSALALFFFLAYLVWTGAYLKLWFAGGWKRYIDEYVERTESLKSRILLLPH